MTPLQDISRSLKDIAQQLAILCERLAEWEETQENFDNGHTQWERPVQQLLVDLYDSGGVVSKREYLDMVSRYGVKNSGRGLFVGNLHLITTIAFNQVALTPHGEKTVRRWNERAVLGALSGDRN